MRLLLKRVNDIYRFDEFRDIHNAILVVVVQSQFHHASTYGGHWFPIGRRMTFLHTPKLVPDILTYRLRKAAHCFLDVPKLL